MPALSWQILVQIYNRNVSVPLSSILVYVTAVASQNRNLGEIMAIVRLCFLSRPRITDCCICNTSTVNAICVRLVVCCCMFYLSAVRPEVAMNRLTFTFANCRSAGSGSGRFGAKECISKRHTPGRAGRDKGRRPGWQWIRGKVSWWWP